MITKNSKILITGCGGMLGDAVYPFFSSICKVKTTDIDVNEKWLSYLDVRDYQALEKEISKFKPDMIFHLAALTDLEYCENNPHEAYETNTMGTENVISLCKKCSIPMVYISTAGIFSGDQDLYNDYDIPNPQSYYGKSKYAGEVAVGYHLRDYFIFRAGWMMGGGPKKDKKFIKKVMDQVKAGKKELFMVRDKLGSPTYTYDFAKNMLNVIKNGSFGLYNMTCKGGCSRFDVAEEMLDILKLKSKIKLTEVTSDHFIKGFFAPRPRSEKLVNLKLDLKGLNGMREWEVCLKEYLKKYKWLK